MSVSYGFYDSINHDRKYNAMQFSSIFDGIIRDGVFMSIGDCFRVTESESSGMRLMIGTGRAWFNHTWTLNDAPFTISIEQSELLLDRIDAVVIDVNSSKEARKNDIIVVKGTPSSNPEKPILINSDNRHQYPLAYIKIKANVTEITDADIENAVGVYPTPFVTGPLETIDIGFLVSQWEAQWDSWYKSQTRKMEVSYDNWQYEMETTTKRWEDNWHDWFYSYINQNQQEFSTWMGERNTEFTTWFDSLKVILDGNVATNLAKRVVELESCCDTVKEFMENLTNEQTIYDYIYDHENAIVLDSEGCSIGSKITFATESQNNPDQIPPYSETANSAGGITVTIGG